MRSHRSARSNHVLIPSASKPELRTRLYSGLSPQVVKEAEQEDDDPGFCCFVLDMFDPIAIVTSPEYVLSCITVLFCGLLVGVWALGDRIDLRRIPMFDKSHDQYVFGVGAIMFVVLFLCADCVWRLYKRDGHQLDALGVAFAAFTQVLLIGAGLYLNFVTRSDIVLALAVFSAHSFSVRHSSSEGSSAGTSTSMAWAKASGVSLAATART